MLEQPPCVFGEVLFDRFPDGSSLLGGAPFNVAWHLQAFGHAPRFISRTGDDDAGRAIRAAMQRWHMETAELQTDAQLRSGEVSVTIANGEPSYDIVHPVAYDAIAPCARCDDCSWLYHGTLALRDTRSRATWGDLMQRFGGKVFVDVNLRSPWWQREQVAQWLQHAAWLKINGDELALLFPDFPVEHDAVAHLFATLRLEGIVITHGSRGATLFTRDGQHEQVRPTTTVDVVDTVGAGDAFASVMLLGLMSDWPSRTLLDRAQQFASRIVANRGATLQQLSDYHPFIDAWDLTY